MHANLHMHLCVHIDKIPPVFRTKTTGSRWWLPLSLSSHWRSSWATWLDRCRWQTAGRFLRWTSKSPAPGDALLLSGRAPLSACTTSASRPPPSGSHEWRRKTTPAGKEKDGHRLIKSSAATWCQTWKLQRYWKWLTFLTPADTD